MNIYKYCKLENNDILLQKINIDITKYIEKKQENGDIILQQKQIVVISDIREIKKYDFTKSIINICTINAINFEKLKYKPILKYIYNLINDGTHIIKNTLLNIKTIKKEDEGFYYLQELGISIQGVDSNKCIYEIVNQCIKNNIKIIIDIKLNNNTDIQIMI